MITIRPEETADIPAIRRLYHTVYGCGFKADGVDALRARHPNCVTLVAQLGNGPIVGHILFGPVSLEGAHGVTGGMHGISQGMGLGFLGIGPAYQRHGIGRALVRHGLKLVARRGSPFVVVHDFPAFFSRFGFRPSPQETLLVPWEGMLGSTIMILDLDGETPEDPGEVVQYRMSETFAGAPHAKSA